MVEEKELEEHRKKFDKCRRAFHALGNDARQELCMILMMHSSGSGTEGESVALGGVAAYENPEGRGNREGQKGRNLYLLLSGYGKLRIGSDDGVFPERKEYFKPDAGPNRRVESMVQTVYWIRRCVKCVRTYISQVTAVLW